VCTVHRFATLQLSIPTTIVQQSLTLGHSVETFCKLRVTVVKASYRYCTFQSHHIIFATFVLKINIVGKGQTL